MLISDAEFNNMTDSRKIMRACRIAGVSYPNFKQTQEWMLGLAETAHEMKFKISDAYAYEGRGMDDLDELAESEVPFYTHKLWIIWADLQLYLEDSWRVEGNYITPQTIESVNRLPQMACYEIALRVLSGWGKGAY